MTKANFGVVGMAVMGRNLALNIESRGYTVAIYNRSKEKTEDVIACHPEKNFVPSYDVESFVNSIEKPRRIMLMVQAGPGTDATIQALLPHLDKGDILIDGGNTFYKDTIRRNEELANSGINFIGTGVSGGEKGALEGPSIMPGGQKEAYELVADVLEEISAKAPEDGKPCVTYIGPDGAGHYVKMVHNGIEYADMQVIGEAYDILRSIAGIEPAQQAEIFKTWNEGDLSSYLIEITAEVLAQVDAKTGKPLVDVIVDAAGQKGTGLWTAKAGLDLGSPVSAIAESVFARALSSSEREQREQAQRELPAGLIATTGIGAGDPEFVEDVRRALFASKLVAYAQGMDLLTRAGKEYGWDLKLDTIASLWRAGCIIRAELLGDIMAAYAGEAPANMLLAPAFKNLMEELVPSWRRVVAKATALGIPVPVFASALSYYDGLRRDRLPASLIQGQRDFFGAHTYGRIDEEGAFHTMWSGDRSEVNAADIHVH